MYDWAKGWYDSAAYYMDGDNLYNDALAYRDEYLGTFNDTVTNITEEYTAKYEDVVNQTSDYVDVAWSYASNFDVEKIEDAVVNVTQVDISLDDVKDLASGDNLLNSSFSLNKTQEMVEDALNSVWDFVSGNNTLYDSSTRI